MAMLIRIAEDKTDSLAMMNLIDIQQSMDLVNAIDLDNPERKQICVLRLEDERTLKQAIGELLNQFRESLNITNTLTPYQSYEISGLLIEKFWYFTVNDFLLAFKKIKLGEYGTIYNRIDIATLSIDLMQYDSERLAFIEAERVRQQGEYRKQNEENEIDYERVKIQLAERMQKEKKEREKELKNRSILAQYYTEKQKKKGTEN